MSKRKQESVQKKEAEVLERYDSIEYGFEGNNPPPQSDSVAVTDKDGFITSQQYVHHDVNEETDESLPLNEEQEKPKREKSYPRETVLVFQLTVCILIAIAAYVIKSFGGEFYENVKELYYSNLNNSIIIDMKNDNNFDFVKDAIDELNDKQASDIL